MLSLVLIIVKVVCGFYFRPKWQKSLFCSQEAALWGANKFWRKLHFEKENFDIHLAIEVSWTYGNLVGRESLEHVKLSWILYSSCSGVHLGEALLWDHVLFKLMWHPHRGRELGENPCSYAWPSPGNLWMTPKLFLVVQVSETETLLGRQACPHDSTNK